MIKETAKVFELGISHDVPEEMKEYLKKDAFIFSGLKTNAQLQEARSLLRDENGHIRPYYLFEKDILKLNEKYNLNYLDAEYQFAQASSQSAANWANLSDSDRYNLQYRTAGDEKVRESHAALNGTTLPKSSAFWISYYPPNGWRCRCIAVLVLASKYPASDVGKATAAAEKATTQIGKNGKNKLEMFRFNPGMQQKVFPANNSYSKVIGAAKAEAIAEKISTEPVFKQIPVQALEKMYKNQFIKKDLEAIIMDYEDGYVATNNSFYLNQKLRENIELSYADKQTVDALDDLIKANKLPDDIIVNRFIDEEFINTNFGFYPVSGDTAEELIEYMREINLKSITNKGYSSTSSDINVNMFKHRKYFLEIRCKKGTNAFIPENFEESEIILGRNQKLNVIDFEEVKGGKIKIIMEAD